MSGIVYGQAHGPGAPRPDILAHVASNMRRLRAAAGLSQSTLADLSGISRRMIVGIESGQGNVSLSTLDRLAEALGAHFSEMVRTPDVPDSRPVENLAWQGKSAQSRATLLGTALTRRAVELWICSLAPGERYPVDPDAARWSEMLYIFEGRLTVEAAEGVLGVERGGSLIFSSDRPYSFVNAGAGRVRFVRTMAF